MFDWTKAITGQKSELCAALDLALEKIKKNFDNEGKTTARILSEIRSLDSPRENTICISVEGEEDEQNIYRILKSLQQGSSFIRCAKHFDVDKIDPIYLTMPFNKIEDDGKGLFHAVYNIIEPYITKIWSEGIIGVGEGPKIYAEASHILIMYAQEGWQLTSPKEVREAWKNLSEMQRRRENQQQTIQSE
jgi:hypothetical protein